MTKPEHPVVEALELAKQASLPYAIQSRLENVIPLNIQNSI